LLIIEFEEENDLLEDIIYREELYFENKKRKEKLKSKMENYIKEVILEEKKAMKDEANKKLLIKESKNFDKYEKETILYSIWGDKWKKFLV